MEMADRVITCFYEVENMAFNGFTEEEIKTIRELSEKIANNLEMKK